MGNLTLSNLSIRVDIWAFVIMLSLSLSVGAQDPDYVLTLSETDGDRLATATVSFTNDDDVEAWSFDVCHDEDDVILYESAVQLGSDIESLVFSVHRIEIQEGGFSVVAILDDDENTLDAGTDLELYEIEYVLIEEGVTDISFCGDYEAANVEVAGDDIEPTTEDGEIDVDGGPLFFLADSTVLLDDEEVTVSLQMISSATINGWSGGVCHDSLLDLSSSDVEMSSSIDSNSYLFESLVVLGGGYTFGTIVSPFGGFNLSADTTWELYVATYEIDDFGESDLEMCEIGSPPIGLDLVTPPGTSLSLESRDAVITILEEKPSSGPLFLRGDCDGNGTVSAITDALRLLQSFFGDAEDPPCMDAADVDGNNSVSPLVDSLTLLQWQFSDGDEPPTPGVETCGEDDDADTDVLCETSGEGCV